MSAADLHYRFPPASAYRLNRCLFALKSDASFRARFAADPASAMDEQGLPEQDRAALSSWNRDALAERGAHPYLVFMAELRLRVDRGGTAYELF